jgi:hypothetical protein
MFHGLVYSILRREDLKDVISESTGQDDRTTEEIVGSIVQRRLAKIYALRASQGTGAKRLLGDQKQTLVVPDQGSDGPGAAASLTQLTGQQVLLLGEHI